tara:strand:- start:415 stop:717 length:303 start_codon:yes stop_codon:yes gene_type:complete
MTPKYTNGKRSNKSELKLQKLKQNKLEQLAKKLDLDIRGYDHIVEYADNHTASLRSDWVDENIRTIIIKHNYQVNKVAKMLIRDFTDKEQEAAENAIAEF